MPKRYGVGFRFFHYDPPLLDIIGDIHGCYKELLSLIKKLGYHYNGTYYEHPQGRRLVTVGDIGDKGYQNVDAFRFWFDQIEFGKGVWIYGNHCMKLYRYLRGNRVHISHGLENTVEELKNLGEKEFREFKKRYFALFEKGCHYGVFDNKKLIVVHGGIQEKFIGRFDERVKAFCLYGDTTGQFDENGKPIRRDWAANYTGRPFVVYGHTVKNEPIIINRTVDIDQGCVYGGYLTAFRYPQMEIVQVPGKAYAKYTGTENFVPLFE